MRILITGFTNNYGGIETFIFNHCKEMKLIDDSIIFDILSTFDTPSYKKEFIEMGGKIFKVERSRNRVKLKKSLKKIMLNSQEKYDIIWCNKCDLANIEYLKSARKCDIPVRILHSHNTKIMQTGIKQYLFRLLHEINKKKVEDYATNFWSCSDYAAKWMFKKNIINSINYEFINNAISLDKFYFDAKTRNLFRNKLNVNDNLVIGCVGRLSYQKNPFFVLKIFKEIYSKNEKARLIWIGTGELDFKIRKKIEYYNLSDVIFLLGYRNDINNYMQAMDCLLLPSRFEGLPIVAIEAQACGLHVFAAQEGISTQTKITRSFTFLSLKNSAEEWAEKIIEEVKIHEDNIYDIIGSNFEIKVNSKLIYNKFHDLVKVE